MARVPRTGPSIDGKNSDHVLQYRPLTQLIRGMYTYLYSLRSIDMNESNLRVNGFPNVAGIWINNFLLMAVKRQQTVSEQTNQSN